jgi:argininosuccinate lyase
MKLWTKNTDPLKETSEFTIGNDREMDLHIAPFDVLGSLAHINMLESIGLLTKDELTALQHELKEIYRTIQKGEFSIAEGVEDVHSQVELMLTQKLGDVGKKIHSGRSRNDQVLVDIKLFLRSELERMVRDIQPLFTLLLEKAEENKRHLLPGYTHLQLAMPSSFGLWLGAYAESLVDDVTVLHAAFQVVNKNPLGSAAGYGSSFPLNRKLTTSLLGFADLNYNVVYAQMGRGKAERLVASALGSVAATLSKLAMDCTLYMNQNFGFISFPDQLTTGSSIMPHKKNPDVFELIRARCNALQALPNELLLISNNLPSGYHRDLQLLKEKLFPAFHTLRSCVDMMHLMLSHMKVTENILLDDRYRYLFSVEEVNKLVLQGVPFRDAYKKVGHDIEAGQFSANPVVLHTHEGSIGNLCLQEISSLMEKEVERFPFEAINATLAKLTA